MEVMKKIKSCLVVLAILFYGYSKACSPLTTPPPGSPGYSFQIVGNNILLNLTSTSQYINCQYHFDVEVVCNGNAFPGVAPYYYSSPTFAQATNPFAVPQMTIPIGGLCAGGVYQIRWIQVSGGLWSTPISFTVPGVPVPVNLQIAANPTAICFPQTSQITSTVSGGCGGGGAIGYTWTPATGLSCVNCPSPVASPSVTTSYTLTVGGTGPSSCWSATAALTIVSFTAFPTVGTPSCIPQLCEGQANQISISSSSGARQWEFANNNVGPWAPVAGGTGSTVNTATLTPGNYCYRLVTAGCGGSVFSTPICFVVYPNPTVSVNSTSICQGATVTLNGMGASQFYWPTGINPTGPITATSNPAQTSAYTATGVANGCSATAAFNISVTPYPIVNLNSNSPVCMGGTITLNTSGSSIYAWQGPNGFVSAIQSPTIGNAVPQMSGVYNVSVTLNTCMKTGSIAVQVKNPQVTASNNGTYCANDNVQLFANGTNVTTYQWSGPGFSSNGQNPILSSAQAGNTGIYTVTASDGFCSATATTAVLVNPLPNPVLVTTAPVCETNSITLNASGAISYYIVGPLSYTSSLQNNTLTGLPALASGVYTVYGTDANGCVNKGLCNVNILPLPPITVTGDEACVNHTASLTVTGAASYTWSGPNGFISNQSVIMFNSLQPSETGSYVVTAVGVNGCTVSAGTTLTFYPSPAPSITITPKICIGSVATFSAEGGYLYTWLGPNNFVSHNQNTSLAVNSLSCAGQYTLGVIDQKGCQGEVTANLVVNPLPTGNVVANTNNKCAPYCASYSLTTPSNITNYYWNMANTGTGPNSTFNYCFTTDGSKQLRLTFTDQNGCSNAATFTANAFPTPKADFHISTADPLEDDQVQFTDASLGPNIEKYEWIFGSDPNQNTLKNPTYTYPKAGNYPVTMIIENKWGCKDTITKAISIGADHGLYIPNVFTPNGDGYNDVFQPKGFGIEKFKMEIFDRWGVRIYSAEDINQPWDGSVKGKIAKDESFVYKISVVDNKGNKKEYTGHVSLLK
jgi:gliding motility-associated-like protein